MENRKRSGMLWHWTAIIAAVAVAAANLALCIKYIQWQREKEQYQAAVQEATAMVVQTIQAVDAIAEDIARTEAERPQTYETDAYNCIGSCKITAYCCEPYPHICGTGDGLTAAGIPVTPGIVSVDPDVIPLGSIVVIDGQHYLAADTGGMVKGLHVDIAVPTHEEAEAFGVQTAEVWVVPQESEEGA